MSDQEEHAPSSPVSEIGDDEASSDAEQASSAHKRRKTGLTKCDDEYVVSKRREALSAKANKGKFAGLRADTPAKRNSAKTAKISGKDFVYGVLFVTLMAFGTKKPVNRTAKWFCYCTSDCNYFYDLTGREGKDYSIVNLQTQNVTSSSGLSRATSSSGPPSAASPPLTSSRAGQSFRFLSVRSWLFSVLI